MYSDCDYLFMLVILLRRLIIIPYCSHQSHMFVYRVITSNAFGQLIVIRIGYVYFVYDALCLFALTLLFVHAPFFAWRIDSHYTTGISIGQNREFMIFCLIMTLNSLIVTFSVKVQTEINLFMWTFVIWRCICCTCIQHHHSGVVQCRCIYFWRVKISDFLNYMIFNSNGIFAYLSGMWLSLDVIFNTGNFIGTDFAT